VSISPAELAERFWQAAGGADSFPRRLEPALLWALPVAIVKLPRLRIGSARTWLQSRATDLEIDIADRRLRACLVAHRGVGIVFVDGTDPDDEQQLSLAHEVAHFLVDYLEPRERVVSHLGPTITEVLDGLRPPSRAERIDGVLNGVPLGIHRHFLTRDGSHMSIGRESRADRVALELLAPRTEVMRRMRGSGSRDERHCHSLLMSDFGLPSIIAESYARLLVTPRVIRPTVKNWLGMDVELPPDAGKMR
jgi:Zn-dependent peptidase ImmA (M78 family)